MYVSLALSEEYALKKGWIKNLVYYQLMTIDDHNNSLIFKTWKKFNDKKDTLRTLILHPE